MPSQLEKPDAPYAQGQHVVFEGLVVATCIPQDDEVVGARKKFSQGWYVDRIFGKFVFRGTPVNEKASHFFTI